MFGRCEQLVDPYPDRAPETPPDSFFGFVWHYTRDVWPWVLLMAIGSMAIGLGEAYLFGVLGTVVDWLTAHDPETFLQDEAGMLIWLAVLILVILPAGVLLQTTVMHQTLAGNHAMLVRWLAHRHLLRQPMSFYADEFAGRIATKVMQTSLAVRDLVMRMFDVFVYVLSFLFGAIAVAAARLPLQTGGSIWASFAATRLMALAAALIALGHWRLCGTPDWAPMAPWRWLWSCPQRLCRWRCYRSNSLWQR